VPLPRVEIVDTVTTTPADTVGGPPSKGTITMNKRFTKVLLSAAILGSGVIGAGSLVAGATDDAGATAISLTDVASEPSALQVVDDATTDVGTDEAPTEDRGRRGCGTGDAVAEVLGLTTDELHDAREAGSSLAEIAATQGVDVDAVVQAIVDDKSERLDEKVAEGDLTAEEAAERLAEIEARAADRVNDAPEA
jgi:hypothetical protein